MLIFSVRWPLLAVLMAQLVAVPTMAEEVKRMERTITVSASGTAEAVPDQARISSGVISEANTAREALTANSAAMGKIIAGLKAAGIEAKDIGTSTFQVDPRYTNPQDGRPPEIDGYRVQNQVEVVVRNLDRLGDILDQLIALGANQAGSLTFEVSGSETLLDAARKQAIANARRRAELYAAAAGAKVGAVMAISEEGASPPMPYFKATRAAAMESVPVERGTQTLTANVTVVWALE